jgi:hypothetical protein
MNFFDATRGTIKGAMGGGGYKGGLRQEDIYRVKLSGPPVFYSTIVFISLCFHEPVSGII